MALATSDPITIAANSPARRALSALGPQLSRYSTVSIVALGIDVGVYSALCVTGVNAPVAGVVGYAVGMIIHYLLSSTFVFDVERSRKSAARRLAEFVASGLLGLVLTGTVIAAVTEYFAAHAIVAKAVAIVVSFFVVFFVRRWVVFAPLQEKESSDAGFVY